MVRPSPALHAALVILVMLAVILGVATWAFFRQYENAIETARHAVDEAQRSLALVRAKQAEVGKLKQLVEQSRWKAAQPGEVMYREVVSARNRADSDVAKLRAELERLRQSCQELLRERDALKKELDGRSREKAIVPDGEIRRADYRLRLASFAPAA